MPHKWPTPKQDLWSQIRAGFTLAPNDERRSVRVWTQFYATHTQHLSASLKRARPFLWHVVQQVKKRGLPTEIALLPIVESGYNPTAKSYKGAKGLWQFMPGTADYMSLPRDWWYDGRDDPIASTNAALNYLQTLNQRYDGDWMLALAAYNAGPGRVDTAIARARGNGRPTDYWHLHLPDETTQYVPQLLALRRIMMTPARFSVDWPTLANRPRTRVVTLPGQTSMKVAARMLGISESRLRRLNPGMRRWASDPGGHGELLVPADKASAFKNKLARIDPGRLVDQHAHVVHRGDTLSRLARAYGVSVTMLRGANGLHSSRIRVGQKLVIPGPGGHGSAPPPHVPGASYVVQSGDTLWRIAHRYGVSIASLKRINATAANTLRPGEKLDLPRAAEPPEPRSVVVHRGDSLWSIASRFSMRISTLRHLNDMSADNTLKPGQRLRLQPAVSG